MTIIVSISIPVSEYILNLYLLFEINQKIFRIMRFTVAVIIALYTKYRFRKPLRTNLKQEWSSIMKSDQVNTTKIDHRSENRVVFLVGLKLAICERDFSRSFCNKYLKMLRKTPLPRICEPPSTEKKSVVIELEFSYIFF